MGLAGDFAAEYWNNAPTTAKRPQLGFCADAELFVQVPVIVQSPPLPWPHCLALRSVNPGRANHSRRFEGIGKSNLQEN
jgi:hypothetical protein